MTHDALVEGRFLSLVPSSGAPSARSSVDISAADAGADGSEDVGRSVRPSTAKRQLDEILKARLDVKNIHVSPEAAEAAEAGWGAVSSRSGRSDASNFSVAGPGLAAGAAKSHLQKLLSEDADGEGGEQEAAQAQARDDDLDELKDKVKAYKARKSARRSSAEDTSNASNTSVASAHSTDEGGEKQESEYDKTIDSCLSVVMGPNKTPDYLEDLWVRAATIAMDHVPRRKAEVVTEVTDRLIKLGRDRRAAELCLAAGYHKVSLQCALPRHLPAHMGCTCLQ